MEFSDALVKPQWSIRQVMEQIDRNGQAIAVVVDDEGRPLGTITDGDIRRAILRDMDLKLPIQELLDFRAATGRREPITAPQGTEQAELLRLMTDYSIRHVPLVDASGRMVDMVAIFDLIQESELPMTAVVMAGGYGTRLRPLTEALPKPMLSVGDRPLLELIINQLHQSGIRRVNLTTHYKKDIIAQHFGDGRDFGVEINYVEEEQPMGTAGALSQLPDSDGPLLVINGDILTKVDFRAMLDFHRESRAEMTVAVRQHESTLPFGVVEIDGVDIVGISEKPVIRHLINAGIYLLESSLRECVPHDRPYDMPELISRLLSDGRRVVGFPIREYWLDIGEQSEYEQAQADAAKQELT